MTQQPIKFPSKEDGYTCECCGSFVKKYCRKLNSSMCAVLILMYHHPKKDFFHVEEWLKEIDRPELRADFHKLRFWRFIEAKSGDRKDGSPRNGMYKITSMGLMFVENKITAKEAAFIFNNKLEGFAEKEINIHDALGKRFDYSELMNPFKHI